LKAEVEFDQTRIKSDERRPQLLNIAMAIVSLFGLADAIYLTVKHLTHKSVPCSAIADCESVLSSEYAMIAGIPLAAIGAIAYFTVFSLATLAASGYEKASKLLSVLVLLMFAETMWLLYVQAFKLEKYCIYCLFSALTTTILTGMVLAKYFLFKSKIQN
jgi:uncharacterized membrane protein